MNIAIYLTLDETNAVLTALSELPIGKVKDANAVLGLINKIRHQAEPQLMTAQKENGEAKEPEKELEVAE